jgi:aerobic-type carbon monoxide dehydrogenase small subunit (CoxS/CutS family)
VAPELASPGEVSVVLTVNGKRYSQDVPAEENLLSVLRDRLGLTGTKYGCGEGQCGACTVLVDDRAVRSCQVTAREASGKRVTTIEGLASGARLHPVQAAFLEVEAFQCGFCTPGFIVAAAALLSSNKSPSDEDISGALAGNICRCCTYPRIVDAVRLASRASRHGGRS